MSILLRKGTTVRKFVDFIHKIRSARQRLDEALKSERTEIAPKPSPDGLRPSHIHPWESVRLAKYLLSRQSSLNSPSRRLLWHRTLTALFPLGGSSLGNDITIYHKGDDAFENMWDAIRNAKRRVYAETYIIEEDTKGKEFLYLLKDAAQRGCEVIFTFDPIGSTNFNPDCDLIKEIIQAGVCVEQFNPPAQWTRTAPIRNHRKILVVDDIAFTGGVNIGDHYCGPAVGGNGFFRDTHARVVGPAVADLERVFFSSLHTNRHWLSPQVRQTLAAFTAKFSKLPSSPLGYSAALTQGQGKKYSAAAFRQSMVDMKTRIAQSIRDTYIQKTGDKASEGSISSDHQEPPPSFEAFPPHTPHEGVFIQVLPSNGARRIRHIQRALHVVLGNCQSYCYITTPYFLPPVSLRNTMIQARRRGIDVRVLTSGKTDVPFMRFASRHIYPLFLKEGIRIYEMKDQALHAKIMAIDDIYCSVGSFNLDVFSNRNLEVNLTMVDSELTHQIRDQFFKDLNISEEITHDSITTQSPLFERLKYRLHYFGARLWHRFAFGDNDYDD